ncbi:MAG TPA: class I SAM-dependent DNA methyltransferase, partial [Candidatus Pacearchaeota archaeon]|nr:class I SAM-dependent DNA methyltransferase [Candidatus Pacearchaeota archaeon]
MSAKDILKSIIDDFDILKFEQFFREKNEKLRFFYEDLNINAPDSFSDAKKIAEAQLHDGNLIICSLSVKKELTERSGKKAQYDIGKQILKQHQADAGIFIFYDSSGKFRFSLIYTNYFGKRRDWSTFKRFTYFVSKDQTNKTFLLQIGDSDFSTLEKIKEAFSVEKVTKEFYNEIANWYFWAIESCQFPKDAEIKSSSRNTAVIRLITRIIFIWFMRERKLVPKILFDEESIKIILKDIDSEKSTYYHAILQNLFFATLSVKKENREFRNEKRFYKGWNEDFGNQYVFRYHNLFVNPEEIKNYFNDIPFLNGGLFECLDDNKNDIYIDGFTERKKYQPTVPNFLFFSEEKMVNLNKYYGTKGKNYKVYGLFNILSSFNFTIDENSPDDAEIALDPELLGRVFENLLASYNPETSTTARKATGSYYTPREIVDYMVSESLKEYFKVHLDDIDGIDSKLNHLFDVEQKENPFSTQDTKRIVTLINDLRIVDPAVGSGAFPMGILNKLVFLLSKLDPDNKLWKEIQIKALDKEITDPILKSKLREQALKYFSEKNFDYGRKLYLIQKCIYGVDIQEIAVEITKLRFFISLLVDEKIDKNQENWGIEPLPNLDFKIMQGNSLIELLSEGFLCSGVDREREKLTKKLKILKDEMFSPLPSKEKKEKRAEINKLIKQIFDYDRIKKINDFKKEIFGIQSQKVLFDDKILKQKNKAIIDEKQKEIKRLENIKFLNPEEHFEWHINFSEVFEEK